MKAVMNKSLSLIFTEEEVSQILLEHVRKIYPYAVGQNLNLTFEDRHGDKVHGVRDIVLYGLVQEDLNG